MELSEIIKLLDAGFTKDDIMALQGSAAGSAAGAGSGSDAGSAAGAGSGSDTGSAAGAGSGSAAGSAAGAGSGSDAGSADDQPGLSAMQAFNTLINKMNDKLDQIQAANIVNSSTGSTDQEETAESVLQELIFPGSK